ncbi:MAG: class I SAM-dependent methyltransferase [Actinomycetota bacterium]|nr:class I SAM-dependent methyltransferase [Actinomycetota bacterium]
MKKFNQLLTLLKPTSSDKILEVGVADKEYSSVDNFLIKSYPYKRNITALGLGNLSEFRKNYPDISVVSYDGRVFPFNDKKFDIAHANAVIEHVGSYKSQEAFLKEIIRVSKRGMITTPNKYFPIELHTKTPLLHYLGKEKFDKFLRNTGRGWASGEYMYLLSMKDLELLIKRTGLVNYKIIKNYFFGFVATFSLIWYGE